MDKDQNKKKPQYNFKNQKLLLIYGLFTVFIGFVLFALVSVDGNDIKLYAIRPVLVILFSILFLYRGITNKERYNSLFFGLFLSVDSVIILLSDFSVIPYNIYQLWPVAVIACGLSLFISCFAHHKKLRASFCVPSIMLVIMGVIFLLFSLDIINMSFRVFAARWWPVLVIFSGIALVVLFIHNQKVVQSGNNKVLSDDDIDEALY